MSDIIRIDITESNFMPKGSYVLFDGSMFKFRNQTKIISEKMSVEQMEHVNRPKATRIGSSTNTNVFSQEHEFSLYGIIRRLFGGKEKRKPELFVRFQGGNYFRGKADISLIFKLNYILLENKNT